MKLSELKSLCEKATPEPWTLDVETECTYTPDPNDPNDDPGEYGIMISVPEIGRMLYHINWAEQKDWGRDLANGNFIAAARTELPRLAALLEQALPWLRQANRFFIMPNSNGKPYPQLEQLIADIEGE